MKRMGNAPPIDPRGSSEASAASTPLDETATHLLLYSEAVAASDHRSVSDLRQSPSSTRW